MTRVFTRGKRDDPLHAWLSELFGRWMLNAVLSEMRGGERLEFAIPTHLAGSLSHK